MSVDHTVYSWRLQYYPSVVYSRRIITVVVNGEYLRSLFTMSVIHRKSLYMTAVNGHCKRLPFAISYDIILASFTVAVLLR